ncbi:hypothetical protein [Lysinibacillus sp. 3P01SB]|uniref:hypothetical protein n=1 Tax=Lysinibacillus sp. 3P01SB TaxID=3132284 RepID=UPI0039A6C033
MNTIVNEIALYNKIDEEMAEQAGLRIEEPVLFYKDNGEERIIPLGDSFEGLVQINEFDTMWSPNEHNLEIKQRFIIENPHILFGCDGVTMEGNKIGIAVHIHSKSSNFQRTIQAGEIVNIEKSQVIDFYYEFPVSTIRGIIELDFFMYLKESSTQHPLHASKAGMILSKGNISSLIIVVDGEGSTFPITEFDDKNGPLWKLDINWVEANIDAFNSSNVTLSLNTAHPLFEQIKSGKMPISRAMMGDILVQAMAMIIQQVVIVEKNSIEESEEIMPGSILSAVQYWVSTFEVDTSSLFTITNTLREHWDRQMIQGGSQDD